MSEFLKKWKRYFTFAALLSCLVNILQLTFPFYMFTIYRNVVISYSYQSLANITVAAVIALSTLGAISYVRSRLLSAAGNDLSCSVRRDIFTVLVQGCVINPNQAYQNGLADLENLRTFFSSPAIYALFDIPWAPFYLALIYLIHPILGLIASIGAVVVVLLSILQEMLIRKSMARANHAFGSNQRFVLSFLRNTEVINGMGMIGAVTKRFLLGNAEVMTNQTQSSYYAGTIQALLKPLQNLIQVLIYCSGAYYAIKEGFNVGLMVAASITMGRGFAPVLQFMGAWQTSNRALTSYRRLRDLEAVGRQRRQPGMQLPAPQGNLRVQNLSLLLGGRHLLSGVNLELAAGEFLGIIGPSGAGKTTFCRMLLGIWPPTVGSVTLDGREMFSSDKEDLGRWIGYLPQEIELFPGSVAQNIARLGEVENKAVERAMQRSGLGSLIESLEQGLETQLEGDKGVRLSGGQKQKLGFARAIYNEPRFLVLDEPTSNMDEQGEQQMMAALKQMKEGRSCTCIMVTHKPSLLHSMDKILVLKQGQVALYGPKSEVLAQLANLQATDQGGAQ